jgi:YidC/Oxa1 family membrane protein insertase
MLLLFDGPVRAAYHVVMWLDSVCQPFSGAASTACAMVLCTVAVRLLLSPLSRAAVRGERTRAALAPDVTELRRRHGKDPARLRREIADLYDRSGTSPVAGCLPVLAQIPVVCVLYRLFTVPTVGGGPNALLGGNLFGLSLGVHWPALTGSPVFLVLAVLMAVVAWLSSRLQTRRLDASAERPARIVARVAPFGTLLSLAVLPPAAGLYLLTTTTWTVVERMLLR